MVVACGSSPEKAVPTRRKLVIEVFATSVYKQPTTYCIKTRTVSSGDIHTHQRAVIPSFGFNRGHVREVQRGYKHECLVAKHLNFERALDKCGHTAHYEKLTETGNRGSEVSGIQVSDCLTALSIWPDLRSHSEIFMASIRRKEEGMPFETLKNSS